MNHEIEDKNGVLILEHPQTKKIKSFPGVLFGAETSSDKTLKSQKQNEDYAFGEMIFNTSLSGYQEILTDPSYCGQIICMTNPQIGNTGVNLEDMESSKTYCAGLVIHELSRMPSNWRSTSSLDSFLKEHNVPGIKGIDTRTVTREVRTLGALRGLILPLNQEDQAEKLFAQLPQFDGRDLIAKVTTKKPYLWNKKSTKPTKHKVVVIDFGLKLNLLNCLEAVGCELTIVPASASASEVLSHKPDGIFLTNGPGDPSAAPYAVETVKSLLGQKPIFGVCMGHQILSLALGAKTYKMKFGHRGANQPVKDHETGRVEVSSHNHGFAIDPSSLPGNIVIGHTCLNDQTVEGISVLDKKAFSVQFHPEASPGPHDSIGLFDRFAKMMG